MEPGPDPLSAPLGETPVGRLPVRTEHGRQLPPGAARRGDEHDRPYSLAVTCPTPTCALRTLHYLAWPSHQSRATAGAGSDRTVKRCSASRGLSVDSPRLTCHAHGRDLLRCLGPKGPPETCAQVRILPRALRLNQPDPVVHQRRCQV